MRRELTTVKFLQPFLPSYPSYFPALNTFLPFPISYTSHLFTFLPFELSYPCYLFRIPTYLLFHPSYMPHLPTFYHPYLLTFLFFLPPTLLIFLPFPPSHFSYLVPPYLFTLPIFLPFSPSCSSFLPTLLTSYPSYPSYLIPFLPFLPPTSLPPTLPIFLPFQPYFLFIPIPAAGSRKGSEFQVYFKIEINEIITGLRPNPLPHGPLRGRSGVSPLVCILATTTVTTTGLAK